MSSKAEVMMWTRSPSLSESLYAGFAQGKKVIAKCSAASWMREASEVVSESEEAEGLAVVCRGLRVV